ncbi:cobalt/nickel transport protein [Micromonospora kangleipakensis]|uniref:Cobalt/nickel transport protein n=1 Tax=Micromonospora kangleipakensis TaxID=1077942 RepID=A0A4Q8B9E9_9ACTN|nr:PDGLE domain-containing protein [Micromonospora kangleipakensis]RZU73765.1 cobalt/nickel transport protein [Micromonospora kangleipakensis]
MRKRNWGFVLGGLLVVLLLAGVVSNYASAHPDGLDSSLLKGCTVNADGEITGGSCPAQRTRDHELADSPLADYGIRGVDNRFLSTGLSGVLGVLLTFALGGGLFWLARRHAPAASAGSDSAGAGASGDDPAGDSDPADAGQRAARAG